MKKIVTTIALIMAFAMTAFASHGDKQGATPDQNTLTVRATVNNITATPGSGHSK